MLMNSKLGLRAQKEPKYRLVFTPQPYQDNRLITQFKHGAFSIDPGALPTKWDGEFIDISIKL